MLVLVSLRDIFCMNRLHAMELLSWTCGNTLCVSGHLSAIETRAFCVLSTHVKTVHVLVIAGAGTTSGLQGSKERPVCVCAVSILHELLQHSDRDTTVLHAHGGVAT